MKTIICILFCFTALMLHSCSCSNDKDNDSLAKKTAKKATSIGLDMIEGISEAVDEKGGVIGEKITDATGTFVEGVGRSLDRQINEHAEHVASVAGRTLIQTVEGLEVGVLKHGHYDELNSKTDLAKGVQLNYFGKVKSQPVTDAFFSLEKEGSYVFKFDFCEEGCDKVILSKEARFDNVAKQKDYVVSFAFDSGEEKKLQNLRCTKIIATRD